VNAAVVEALSRKYAVMCALREAHARGEGIAPASTLRALAGDFPGVLHELDRLPPEMLRARVVALEHARRDPTATQPWMEHVWAWHALLAATLRAKRSGLLRAGDPAHVAQVLTRESGVTVDRATACSLMAPKGGRVTPWVLHAVAAHFGHDENAVRASLFPWRD
jgi:hypothetical protein